MTKRKQDHVVNMPTSAAEVDVVKKQITVQAVPAATPMALLQMAVQQNADIDKLEKLMALQERWEANEARKAYVSAMAAFKADPPDIFKTKAVAFTATSGDVVSYKHALLSDATEQIGKALSVHGLSATWQTEQLDGGMTRVTCIITHALGHSERVSLQAGLDQSGKKNNIQALGSTISYLERYTLFAITGLAAKDQDDDGNGSEERGLPESQYVDFKAAIDSCVDEISLNNLWKEISAACKKKEDKESYYALKIKVTEQAAKINQGGDA